MNRVRDANFNLFFLIKFSKKICIFCGKILNKNTGQYPKVCNESKISLITIFYCSVSEKLAIKNTFFFWNEKKKDYFFSIFFHFLGLINDVFLLSCLRCYFGGFGMPWLPQKTHCVPCAGLLILFVTLNSVLRASLGLVTSPRK